MTHSPESRGPASPDTIRAAWRDAGNDLPRPYRDVIKLDAALRAANSPDYRGVAWKPVDPAEIAEAEQALGVALPPSYVRFVTTHGVFVISGDRLDGYDSVAGRYHRLLPPRDLARITLRLRRHAAGDDEDEEAFLADALCFQANLYDDNFFAFRISSRRDDGELGVGAWEHDDANQWPEQLHGFDDHLVALCADWLARITSGEP